MTAAVRVATSAQADFLSGLSAIAPGSSVLVLCSDLLEVCRKVASRLGDHGRILAAHVDPEIVRKVRLWTAPGEIQIAFHTLAEDLRISREAADACVRENAPGDLEGLRRLEAALARLREQPPLVADASVDVIICDALSEMPSKGARLRMLKEFHRVLRRGGRMVLLDVVTDEPFIPSETDAAVDRVRAVETDNDLLAGIAATGLYGAHLSYREAEPYRTAGQAELRRVVIQAFKGKEGACWDHHQAVLYRGPFSKVEDDDGHVYVRGQHMAVCKKTFEILSREPYAQYFEHSEPLTEIAAEAAQPFPCNVTGLVREARQLKRTANAAVVSTEAPSASAAPSPAATEAPATPSRRVRVYGKGGAAHATAARAFAEALGARLRGHADVQFVDLDVPGEADQVPAQLRLRMMLGGDESLPAIAVDGVLSAVGGVPKLEEVDRFLATGSAFGSVPFGTKATEEMRAAAIAGCGPDGCC